MQYNTLGCRILFQGQPILTILPKDQKFIYKLDPTSESYTRPLPNHPAIEELEDVFPSTLFHHAGLPRPSLLSLHGPHRRWVSKIHMSRRKSGNVPSTSKTPFSLQWKSYLTIGCRQFVASWSPVWTTSAASTRSSNLSQVVEVIVSSEASEGFEEMPISRNLPATWIGSGVSSVRLTILLVKNTLTSYLISRRPG